MAVASRIIINNDEGVKVPPDNSEALANAIYHNAIIKVLHTDDTDVKVEVEAKELWRYQYS
ncbi:MAG: hypothetical protein OCU20_03460 [Methanophagales archaeon]|nr:hypothetical protein [Methanophagales archaeon]MCW7069855.1 hypothetical protein [Methanophagales archaeon]MCW7072940.1 hypothetical protein [Methanophagales archaeon]